jgi:hypothetical protein
MPAFTVTPLETVQNFSISFIGIEGERKTRSIKVGASFTETMLDNLENALGGISNAGVYRVQGAGVKKEVAIPTVLVYDEAHGINDDLIFTFQHDTTLETRQFFLPAPDAALFQNGVTLKPADDAVQGARILQAINALAAAFETDGVAGNWLYASGYLSTARASEKRTVPNAGSVEEPPTGTPADDPAENPA